VIGGVTYGSVDALLSLSVGVSRRRVAAGVRWNGERDRVSLVVDDVRGVRRFVAGGVIAVDPELLVGVVGVAG
jgi:hypothetical protein